VLLIVLTTIIWKRSKKYESKDSELLTTSYKDKRFLTQIQILTGFYITATFFDWV
jgi:hypothetical protein